MNRGRCALDDVNILEILEEVERTHFLMVSSVPENEDRHDS